MRECDDEIVSQELKLTVSSPKRRRIHCKLGDVRVVFYSTVIMNRNKKINKNYINSNNCYYNK